MNREQRRNLEKESKKNSIRMTPERIHEIKEDVTKKAINCASEDLMTCFMVVLRRMHGFGYRRLRRTFKAIDQAMGRVNEDPEAMERMKQILRDEVGIEIKY